MGVRGPEPEHHAQAGPCGVGGVDAWEKLADANGVGWVSNTTAWGGETAALRSPGCCSQKAAAADHGRARPAHLAEQGHARLAAVQAAVYAIEQHMTEAIPPQRMAALLADRDRIASALEE